MNRFSLSGKNAVVTAAAAVSAALFALGLAEAGANVALTIANAAMKPTRSCGRSKSSATKPLHCSMNVADRASVEAAAKNAKDALGAIAILVNNAGINKPADFDKVTDSDGTDILSTT